MRFRTLPIECDAIRFDGANDADVEAFIRQTSDAAVEWLESPRRPVVPTPRGSAAANVGEWIVRLDSGAMYPMSPKLLDAITEPIPE